MTRRRPDLSSESGVAMLIVLMAMVAGTMLSVMALNAAGADLPFARESQDRKQAYAAAEAGLEYYLFQLSQDNDYWTRCTNVPAPSPTEPSPVNQRWSGTGPDPRQWRNVSGAKSRYTLELIPATGTSCVPGSASSTMLNRGTGTFRVRSTGRSNTETRSVLATLRRTSFLDFIYFTDLETSDPATYATETDRTWASANCNRVRAGRHDNCREIQFASDDAIKGPFHTNDDILLCGNTTFGRQGQDPPDSVEVSGPGGYQPAGSCTASPRINGTWKHPSDSLTMPQSNAALQTAALPGYLYTGRTSIRLRGNVMDVTTGSPAVTQTGVALPSNGVIYVRNGACSGTLTPMLQRYDDPVGCATVSVNGTYNQSLTVASANDVVVNGDLRRSGDVVLGLIANNFVRVAHPVSRSNVNDADSCTNATGTMQNVTIEAAILSLAHSFIVDNHACGAKLGTLRVFGAIAQKFRGPVGTTTPTGYIKDYEYDDRLRYRSPPFFLDPVAASWKVARVNEQVPATG